MVRSAFGIRAYMDVFTACPERVTRSIGAHSRNRYKNQAQKKGADKNLPLVTQRTN